MDLEKALRAVLIGQKFLGKRDSYVRTANFDFGELVLRVGRALPKATSLARHTRPEGSIQLRAWAADWHVHEIEVGTVVSDVTVSYADGKGSLKFSLITKTLYLTPVISERIGYLKQKRSELVSVRLAALRGLTYDYA